MSGPSVPPGAGKIMAAVQRALRGLDVGSTEAARILLWANSETPAIYDRDQTAYLVLGSYRDPYLRRVRAVSDRLNRRYGTYAFLIGDLAVGVGPSRLARRAEAGGVAPDDHERFAHGNPSASRAEVAGVAATVAGARGRRRARDGNHFPGPRGTPCMPGNCPHCGEEVTPEYGGEPADHGGVASVWICPECETILGVSEWMG